MSTCEPPADLPITGVGRLLEARVCRPKKSTDKGEATAATISDAMPFLLYDLHQQIMYKLKVRPTPPSLSPLSPSPCDCIPIRSYELRRHFECVTYLTPGLTCRCTV